MSASARAPADWTPCGVVALLSDFGLQDPYVGQMKAVLVARVPAVRLIDLTHDVPAQKVEVAAFFLARSRGYFPAGTVHLAVVDPGVGSARRLLVAWDEGQAFLAPDNGLLPAALSPRARFLELDAPRFALPNSSRTFHGRDVLAPAAAALVLGLAPWEAGSELDAAPVAGHLPEARRAGAGRVEARVLFADRFGNLVLDARAQDLEGDPGPWRAEARGREIGFHGTYAEVGSGQALALVDSFGSIEIAVRDGSAAASLGLSPGDPVLLRRRP